LKVDKHWNSCRHWILLCGSEMAARFLKTRLACCRNASIFEFKHAKPSSSYFRIGLFYYFSLSFLVRRLKMKIRTLKKSAPFPQAPTPKLSQTLEVSRHGRSRHPQPHAHQQTFDVLISSLQHPIRVILVSAVVQGGKEITTTQGDDNTLRQQHSNQQSGHVVRLFACGWCEV